MNIVHHLALHCRDRHAQAAFYAEQFGFKQARVLNAGEPSEFAVLRLGGMCLELFAAKETGASGGEQPVGFKHLAFEVPSLEEAIAKLQSAGVQPDPIIDLGGKVPGWRVCFFRDPEGNVIELVQGWQDE